MGAKRKYMWEDWFDKPHTLLVRGVDYHCSQSAMAGMVRNNASQRGVRVRIIDTGWSITIEVTGEVPHTDKVAVTS